MEQAFSRWLERNTKIGDKGRRDIISRLKRANRYLDIDKVKNDDEIRYLLSQNEEFTALSAYVKSQLKRSVHFYMKFLGK